MHCILYDLIFHAKIVSLRDSLHEMSNPFFFENKKKISMSSVVFAQKVIKVKHFRFHVFCRLQMLQM